MTKPRTTLLGHLEAVSNLSLDIRPTPCVNKIELKMISKIDRSSLENIDFKKGNLKFKGKFGF